MATKPPIFKPKNTGSLIPKKRKLVKTMMLEYVVDSIATLLPNCCGGHRPIKGGGGAEPPKPTADKNEKKIFPLQPWYVSLSICSCNLWSTHCSMVGWDQVCIFQFSASFSRLLYVLFFVVWMIPIELWFLCMIPSLVYGLGRPLCSELVLFPLPCYKLKSETHRLIPDSFHRFHSEADTIAHFQKNCRKTFFLPAEWPDFFIGSFWRRVALQGSVKQPFCGPPVLLNWEIISWTISWLISTQFWDSSKLGNLVFIWHN